MDNLSCAETLRSGEHARRLHEFLDSIRLLRLSSCRHGLPGQRAVSREKRDGWNARSEERTRQKVGFRRCTSL